MPDPNVVFGRLKAPDARDIRYPMRTMLPAQVPIVTKLYDTGPVLDQGQTPMCVGYSWRQFLASAPVMSTDGPSPEQICHEAQLNDEWPGENYDGSSVRGGAKALTIDGKLKSYVWASTVYDIRDFLITTGTVVMGTDWLEGMFQPKGDGTLNVKGAVVGGHAYLLCGYDAKKNRFQMINSWGAGWGLAGKAWINFSDMGRLLMADGEACAAVEQEIAPAVITLEQVASDLQKLTRRVEVLEKK